MRILLIEDSARLRGALDLGLRKEGYAVDQAADGHRGLSYARNNPYDAIVLDLGLPGMDGMTLLRTLRQEGCDTHVLILTARDAVDDRVSGLEAGADDYLVKPFSFAELLARLSALIRRKYNRKSPVVEVGSLVLDRRARTVTCNGDAVLLPPREYAVLEVLALRSGRVVTREQIEDSVYDEGTFPSGNAVNVSVCRLRALLGELEGAPTIITQRGRGYLLQVPPR